MEKKPEWLKVRYNQDAVNEVAALMRDLKLNTVCKEANCPNLGECYQKHTSTFMILGSICTRNCRFCNVTTGHPLPPDPEEPMNVAKAAKKLSDMLGCDLAIAHKGRPRHNAAEVMGIIGDIKGKTCIINDDMIDTAGTLCANVKELKAMGAGDIYVCATHGIFSGPAIERLNDAPIVECVVTDAIPVEVGGKIKTISVAEEFAQAISAVYHEEPVSTLVGGDFAL